MQGISYDSSTTKHNPSSSTSLSQKQPQLFEILAGFLQNSPLLEAQSEAFWTGVSIETLLKLQNIPIVNDINTLAIDFWGDDSIEDFLAFLK
jgi:hypothetical protein